MLDKKRIGLAACVSLAIVSIFLPTSIQFVVGAIAGISGLLLSKVILIEQYEAKQALH